MLRLLRALYFPKKIDIRTFLYELILNLQKCFIMKKLHVAILISFLTVGSAFSQNFDCPFVNYNLPVNTRVEDLISRLTLDEKMAMLQHNSPAVERLGIKPYSWWNEALHGVARAGIATVFPQPVALAATFDDKAIEEMFSMVSDEARAKYHDAQRYDVYGDYCGLTFFTPNINIFRDPRWGRGMETYGEDPFLTAMMGAACVRGLQGNDAKYLKTLACAKHLVAHSGPESVRHEFDASVSDYDLNNTYLPAFEYLVKEAKVEAVMCAYNRLDDTPCCTNNTLLLDILRNKWDFDGLVITDCWALNDTWERDTIIPRHETYPSRAFASAAAFSSEVDLECGNGLTAMKEAVAEDMLSEADVDVHLTRVLTARMKLGMFDPDSLVQYSLIPLSVVACEKHSAMALKIARESIVLLKNERHVLPLCQDKYKKIAVIGPNAADSLMPLGNYNGTPVHTVTVLEGIQKMHGFEVAYYDKGCNLVDDDYKRPDDFMEKVAACDVVIFAGGLSPEVEGEELKVKNDGFNGGDRTTIELPAVQRNLLKKLEATGVPVVFVLCSGSAVALSWENDNLDAILCAWYGGQAMGTAVSDVLSGKYNPSGKLPVTFYRSDEQLPPFEDYSMNGRTYRYMTEEPLFPFGFGLSYSRFKQSFSKRDIIENEDGTATVTVQVKNKGPYDGDEVVQLYEKNMKGTEKSLIGFRRVFVPAGESREVKITFSNSKKNIPLHSILLKYE